jgi:hypothetical protein
MGPTVYSVRSAPASGSGSCPALSDFEEENLMSFDQEFFWSHVNRARQATDPDARFDALWKAFNVYYESFHEAGRNNQEHELIRRAMERMPAAKYQSIFAPEHIRALTELDPIYDEELWHRFGNKDKGRHIEAQRALRQVLEGEQPFPATFTTFGGSALCR